MADNITHANMLFYPLYYDTINLTNLKITQVFHLLPDFAENQIIFCKIQNSVWITKSSDNGDSDNWGPTVLTYLKQWFCQYPVNYNQSSMQLTAPSIHQLRLKIICD